MFINLMPEEAFKPGTRKASLPLSVKELIALDSCVKCGSCVEVCPVYAQTQKLESTMGGLFANLKSFIRKAYGLPGMFFEPAKTKGVLREYSEHPYLCTLCGRCTAACPAFIHTKDLRIAMRGFMVERGECPPVVGPVSGDVKRSP